jgi:transcription antitermination factor NusG
VSSVKEVDNKAKTVIVEIEVFGKLINTTTPFSFLKKLGK